VLRLNSSPAVTFDVVGRFPYWVDGHAQSARTQYREILRFVRRRVGSSDVAEDITQEVFTQAAETLARSATSAPPTLAWLYTVARRRLIDEARRRRLETVPLELVGDPEDRSGIYGGALTRALAASLSRLPEAQRRVVVMHLLEGRSFADIGEVLGAGEDACRMRFMRGLKQLRIDLEKEGLHP
jgi:RNA polymerase sigma-70 factor (ECF subfamily)